jgi:hypothetical protein
MQICSFGLDGKSSPLLKTHSIETLCKLYPIVIDNGNFIGVFSITVDPQYITFECQRLLQSPDLSFNLSWTLPSFLRYGDVISDFVVISKFRVRVDNHFAQVQVDNTSVPLPQVMQDIIIS